MNQSVWRRSAALCFGCVLVVVLAARAAEGEGSGGKKKGEPPRYIGAKKCGNCHSAKESGDQYGKWLKGTGQQRKHIDAFKALATGKARELAQKQGIKDPQKSEKCLKCHVTALGVPASRLAKGFDRKLGVQCEACHGPGERHFKGRFAAAAEGDDDDEDGFGFGEEEEEEEFVYKPVPKGEIISRPPLSTCVGCHNKESPAFKAFCFKERFARIQHFDPRRKRTKKLIGSLKCTCKEEKDRGPNAVDKCACQKGECGSLPDILREMQKSSKAAGDKEGSGKQEPGGAKMKSTKA